MRNYRKGEVAWTKVGLFRIVEDMECGSHWISAETMPGGEPCKLRERQIVAVLEVRDVPQT